MHAFTNKNTLLLTVFRYLWLLANNLGFSDTSLNWTGYKNTKGFVMLKQQETYFKGPFFIEFSLALFLFTFHSLSGLKRDTCPRFHPLSHTFLSLQTLNASISLLIHARLGTKEKLFFNRPTVQRIKGNPLIRLKENLRPDRLFPRAQPRLYFLSPR